MQPGNQCSLHPAFFLVQHNLKRPNLKAAALGFRWLCGLFFHKPPPGFFEVGSLSPDPYLGLDKNAGMLQICNFIWKNGWINMDQPWKCGIFKGMANSFPTKNPPHSLRFHSNTLVSSRSWTPWHFPQRVSITAPWQDKLVPAIAAKRRTKMSWMRQGTRAQRPMVFNEKTENLTNKNCAST